MMPIVICQGIQGSLGPIGPSGQPVCILSYSYYDRKLTFKFVFLDRDAKQIL